MFSINLYFFPSKVTRFVQDSLKLPLKIFSKYCDEIDKIFECTCNSFRSTTKTPSLLCQGFENIDSSSSSTVVVLEGCSSDIVPGSGWVIVTRLMADIFLFHFRYFSYFLFSLFSRYFFKN